MSVATEAVGNFVARNVAAPATCGVAIEVPLRNSYEGGEPWDEARELEVVDVRAVALDRVVTGQPEADEHSGLAVEGGREVRLTKPCPAPLKAKIDCQLDATVGVLDGLDPEEVEVDLGVDLRLEPHLAVVEPGEVEAGRVARPVVLVGRRTAWVPSRSRRASR